MNDTTAPSRTDYDDVTGFSDPTPGYSWFGDHNTAHGTFTIAHSSPDSPETSYEYIYFTVPLTLANQRGLIVRGPGYGR